MLKHAHDAGNHQPQAQQNHQPGQALSDAPFQRLLQILLCRQASQPRIVLAHLVVHELGDVLGRQHALEPVVRVQHGDGVLGILLHPLDAVLNLFVRVDVGIGRHRDALQPRALARDDQILQVDRADEHVLLVDDVKGGNVVVIRRLLDQLVHSLADADAAVHADVVGRHPAADLVIVKGAQQGDLTPHILVHQLDEDVPLRLFQLSKVLHRGAGLHAGENLHPLADAQLAHVLFQQAGVFQHAGERVRLENAVQPHSLVLFEQLQRGRDVVFMVLKQPFLHFPGRQVAAQNVCDFRSVIGVLRDDGGFRHRALVFRHCPSPPRTCSGGKAGIADRVQEKRA